MPTAEHVMDTTDADQAARVLRDCLGLFATGVTIVTCRNEGRAHGFTANAFTSVSLDPPLVLVSVARRARASAALAEVPFAVHVLAAGDLARAWHFAGRPQADLDLRWSAPAADPPLLDDALAVIECEPWQSHDGGDHVLHLGRVRRVLMGEGAPLLFFRGGFHGLGPAVEA